MQTVHSEPNKGDSVVYLEPNAKMRIFPNVTSIHGNIFLRYSYKELVVQKMITTNEIKLKELLQCENFNIVNIKNFARVGFAQVGFHLYISSLYLLPQSI